MERNVDDQFSWIRSALLRNISSKNIIVNYTNRDIGAVGNYIRVSISLVMGENSTLRIPAHYFKVEAIDQTRDVDGSEIW